MECSKFPRNNAKRHASYVARAPPSSRSARPIRDPRLQGEGLSSRAVDDSRLATLDPLAEESLGRGLSQQDRLSGLITPVQSKPRPNPARQPTPSRDQSKSLTRFTKELERYSTAIKSNGKPDLPRCTPTVSDSPTTLDTVTEFLPYHKQFKAAGLAVTSYEQMPRIPESSYQRRPNLETRKGQHAPLARMQIDGSTVTPSEQEQEPVPEAPAAPQIPESEAGPSIPQTQHLPSIKRAAPVNKTLLPWFRKKDAPAATKAHSNRKFSVDHIHPSRATAAEPYLTPSDKLGIIDAYFDSPSPAVPQETETGPHDTSSSSSSSPHHARSLVDRPLPEEPLLERQPVPRRSLRRHMEDTSQWPTAGVLIHDKSPSPRHHDNGGAECLAEIQERPPVPAKDLTPERSLSSATVKRIEQGVEGGNTPPVPPKGPRTQRSAIAFAEDVEKKPATPPKDFLETQSQPQAASRHYHPGQSLCKQWSRVTVLRRKSHAKLSPVPAAIQEETEATAEQLGKPPSDEKGHDLQTAPQLPSTWSCAVGSSSSFEQALDAVIHKLDDMDERRQYERRIELEAAQRAAKKLGPSQELVSSLGSPSGSHSRRQTEDKMGSPAAIEHSDTNESATYLDSDIDDRDILLGLKMAICAACDEDLDAWIRNKTGLRLRRFLADLKAFDAVSKDRKPSAPQPLHRQIRRNRNETRRLDAERERRRQSMKSKVWKGPCLGADG